MAITGSQLFQQRSQLWKKIDLIVRSRSDENPLNLLLGERFKMGQGPCIGFGFPETIRFSELGDSSILPDLANPPIFVNDFHSFETYAF